MKYKVGIIGHGFVGEAQSFAFSPIAEIKVYDIDPLKRNSTLDEVYKCDFVFVAVPTPMYMDGTQDISYIEDVFEKAQPGPIYIIKSTVLPGTTARLVEKFPTLDIIFSPEFLTQRTAKLDMLTQARIIFGGDETLTGVTYLIDVREIISTYDFLSPYNGVSEPITNSTFIVRADKISIEVTFYKLWVLHDKSAKI